MAEAANFADPAYEPSDEELVELAAEAFGHVGKEAERAVARLHDEIGRLRQEVMQRVRQGDLVESA